MARLRFPGRPGLRFDRLGIRYGAEDARNANDPSLAIVAYIHYGLRQFREAFGESDEDEEFEGFTRKDVAFGEKKLAKTTGQLVQKLLDDDSESPTDFSVMSTHVSHTHSRLATQQRTKGRVKAVIRKSCKDWIKCELVKPSKSQVTASVREVERMKRVKNDAKHKKIVKRKRALIGQRKENIVKLRKSGFKVKLKVFESRKIARPRGRQPKGDKHGSDVVSLETSPNKVGRPRKTVVPVKGLKKKAVKVVCVPKSKKSEKTLARQLLKKAKQGRGVIAVSRTLKLKYDLPIPPVHKKKEFVLPTVSSRSSRVIIPNKRFIEQDDYYAKVWKKPKQEASPSSKPAPKFPKSPIETAMLETKTKISKRKNSPAAFPVPGAISPVFQPKGGNSVALFSNVAGQTGSLLTGKRQRKPSLKMQLTMPLSSLIDMDESSSASQGSSEKSMDLFPKRKGSSTGVSVFSRAGPMSLPGLGKRGGGKGQDSLAAKRRGDNILRKAKLQLNRVAVNRSKAALARSLKAQMKREAKLQLRMPKTASFAPQSPTSPLSLSPMSGSRPFMDMPSSPTRPLFDNNNLPVSQEKGKMSKEKKGRKTQVSPKVMSSLTAKLNPRLAQQVMEAVIAEDGQLPPEGIDSRGGPRIKHVCRRAAMVLPKPVAKFPSPPSLRLSALPSLEKEQILLEESKTRAEDSSDDERPMEEIIRNASLQEASIIKRTVVRPQAPSFPFTKTGRRRKVRCQECDGCRAKDCGECVYCLDKPKFGGRSVMKQACIKRRCSNPKYAKITSTFILKNLKSRDEEPDDDNSQQDGRQQFSSKSSQNSTGGSNGGGGQRLSMVDNGQSSGTSNGPPLSSAPLLEEGKKAALLAQARRVARAKEKAVQSAKHLGAPLKQLSPGSNRWMVPSPEHHLIKANYYESYSLDVVWQQGMALTMLAPACVRTVCYLCSSAGRHELIYCMVCCEPFHMFCLEGEERPEEENMENWCCRRCQFCNVCGHQNHLLQCDRCQSTYHPECLGPNYPTRPSRKNIWVCTKCVKCKSCGATTPGVGTTATWTYDFSLCYDCGKLMDKGNFCPICHKCYSDDDWESKMIQCLCCDSWVHAKCEDLSDEMYQLLSYLPEDVNYKCRICSPARPARWELLLQAELVASLKTVLLNLYSMKCAQHLIAKEDTKTSAEKRKSPAKSTTPVPMKIEEGDIPVSMETQGSAQSVSPLTKSSEDIPSTSASSQVQSSTASCDSDGQGKTTPSCDSDGQGKTTPSCDSDGQGKTTPSCDSAGQGETTPLCDSARQVEKCLPCDSTGQGKTTPSCDSAGKRETTTSPSKTSQSVDDSCIKPSDVKNERLDTITEKHSIRKEADRNIFKIIDECLLSDKTSPCCGDTQILDEEQTRASMKPASSDSVSIESGEKSDVGKMDVIDDKGDVLKSELKRFGTEVNRELQSDFCNPNESPVKNEVLASPKASPGKEPVIKTDPPSPRAKETSAHEGEGANSRETTLSADTPPMYAGTPDSGCSMMVQCDPREKLNDSLKSNDFEAVVDNKTLRSANNQTPKKTGTEAITTESAGFGCLALKKYCDSREFPEDFETVRVKLDAEKYVNVVEFSEDMVHIIQTALSDPTEQTPSRKKVNNSVRSVFLKQMERCFPWFNTNICKLWEHNKNLPEGMLPDAVLPPTSDHTYAQWLEREEPHLSPQPSPFKRIQLSPIRALDFDCDDEESEIMSDYGGEDLRQCLLCSDFGDESPNEAGRLLYIFQDDWVHVNCALWSAEVFEESDGSLQNVHIALGRGRQMRCEWCGKSGATVGCCNRGCSANYHFKCARVDNCVFQEDKKVYCKKHTHSVDGELVEDGGFRVLRRMYIDTKGRYNKKNWSKGVHPTTLNILIGSCTIESLGYLGPLSDVKGCLLPIDFTCTRVYWSTADARRRSVYTCRIVEVRPNPVSPEMKISDMRIVHDETHPDFIPFEKLDLEVKGILHMLSPTSESSVLLSSTTVSMTNSASSAIQPYSQVEPPESAVVLPTPVSQPKPEPPRFDLNLLSPNTLKYLSKADLEKYMAKQSRPPTPTDECEDDDFGNLNKIVERLNQAASGRTKRATSVEKTFRATSPATMPRSKRSSSCDYPSTKTMLKTFGAVAPPTPRPASVAAMPLRIQIRVKSSSGQTFEPPVRMSSPNTTMSLLKIVDTPEEGLAATEDGLQSETGAAGGVCVAQSGAATGLSLEEEIAQKVLEAVPQEILDSSDGDTVVIMTDDADISQEEALLLAQAALEGSREHMESSGDNVDNNRVVESIQDNIESSRDNLESIQDNIESSRVNLESIQDNIESSRDNLESKRDDVESSGFDVEEQLADNSTKTKDKAAPIPSEIKNETKEDTVGQVGQGSGTSKDDALAKSLLEIKSDVNTTDEVSSPIHIHPKVDLELKNNESEDVKIEGNNRINAACKVSEQTPQTSESSTSLAVSSAGISLSSTSNIQTSASKMETAVGETSLPLGLPNPTLQGTSASQGSQNTTQEPVKSFQKPPKAFQGPSLAILQDPPKASERSSSINPLAATPQGLHAGVISGLEQELSRVPVYKDGVLIGWKMCLPSSMEKKIIKRSVEKKLKPAKKLFCKVKGNCEKNLPIDCDETVTLEKTVLPKTTEVASESLSKENKSKDSDIQLGDEGRLIDLKVDGTDDDGACINESRDGETKCDFLKEEKLDDFMEDKCKIDKALPETSTVDVNPEADIKLEPDSESNVNESVQGSSGNKSSEPSGHSSGVVEKKDEVVEMKDDVGMSSNLSRSAFKRGSVPLKTYPLRRTNRRSSDLRPDSKTSDELPLHDKIARKIKAESLAKSSPGDKGPFKCQTCRRLYRTKESFNTHVQDCDFEVSTSEEDEQEEEEEPGPRRTRLRSQESNVLKDSEKSQVKQKGKRGRPPKKRKIEGETSQVGEESSKIPGEESSKTPEVQGRRSSKRLLSPQESSEPPVKRGRGRPVIKDVLKQECKEEAEDSDKESPVVASTESPVKKDEDRGTENADKTSEASPPSSEPPAKRGRGRRPYKHLLRQESKDEEQTPGSQDTPTSSSSSSSSTSTLAASSLFGSPAKRGPGRPPSNYTKPDGDRKGKVSKSPSTPARSVRRGMRSDRTSEVQKDSKGNDSVESRERNEDRGGAESLSPEYRLCEVTGMLKDRTGSLLEVDPAVEESSSLDNKDIVEKTDAEPGHTAAADSGPRKTIFNVSQPKAISPCDVITEIENEDNSVAKELLLQPRKPVMETEESKAVQIISRAMDMKADVSVPHHIQTSSRVDEIKQNPSHLKLKRLLLSDLSTSLNSVSSSGPGVLQPSPNQTVQTQQSTARTQQSLAQTQQSTAQTQQSLAQTQQSTGQTQQSVPQAPKYPAQTQQFTAAIQQSAAQSQLSASQSLRNVDVSMSEGGPDTCPHYIDTEKSSKGFQYFVVYPPKGKNIEVPAKSKSKSTKLSKRKPTNQAKISIHSNTASPELSPLNVPKTLTHPETYTSSPVDVPKTLTHPETYTSSPVDVPKTLTHPETYLSIPRPLVVRNSSLQTTQSQTQRNIFDTLQAPVSIGVIGRPPVAVSQCSMASIAPQIPRPLTINTNTCPSSQSLSFQSGAGILSTVASMLQQPASVLSTVASMLQQPTSVLSAVAQTRYHQAPMLHPSQPSIVPANQPTIMGTNQSQLMQASQTLLQASILGQQQNMMVPQAQSPNILVSPNPQVLPTNLISQLGSLLPSQLTPQQASVVSQLQMQQQHQQQQQPQPGGMEYMGSFVLDTKTQQPFVGQTTTTVVPPGMNPQQILNLLSGSIMNKGVANVTAVLNPSLVSNSNVQIQSSSQAILSRMSAVQNPVARPVDSSAVPRPETIIHSNLVQYLPDGGKTVVCSQSEAIAMLKKILPLKGKRQETDQHSSPPRLSAIKATVTSPNLRNMLNYTSLALPKGASSRDSSVRPQQILNKSCQSVARLTLLKKMQKPSILSRKKAAHSVTMSTIRRHLALSPEKNGIIHGQISEDLCKDLGKDIQQVPATSHIDGGHTYTRPLMSGTSAAVVPKSKKVTAKEKVKDKVKAGKVKKVYKKSLSKGGVIMGKGQASLKPKAARRRKSPLRPRNIHENYRSPCAISHPMIHHQKEVTSLPQPELEEEVQETPMMPFFDINNQSKHGNRKPKDQSHLVFEITSDDGFQCVADTMEDAWHQVTEKVQDARSAARMKALSYVGLKSTSMFGVNNSTVVYLLEQLYGAKHCQRYGFRYFHHDIQALEEETPEHPSGCVRGEPFVSRKPYDMFSFLMSLYRFRPSTDAGEKNVEMYHKSARRATSMDLPMAMRFRKLQEHAKEAVGVYRSHIHGRGLFCKRTIDSGEMVIEYAGEVIRASLTDKREKYYESKGIGCYMFRIDDFEVVDATMHGSAARFINHSCDPNCYSRVINVDGKKHIVIFAMRAITKGEELTYDYKFPIEEVKIPCSCGSKKCRRYLN